jgi:cytochrome c oxidase subunit III
VGATLVGPELESPPDFNGGNGRFDDLWPGSGNGGRGGGHSRHHDPYRTLTWVILIPVVMFFVGLTSSMVVRQGISDDWISISLPWILSLNTLVLLASSVTFEIARRAMKTSQERFKTLLWITASLGTLFLGGQLLAWKQLAAQGLFLSSNPSSAFFYVLTATHGVHLFGALAALIYLTSCALRNRMSESRKSALRTTAVFWHFMDGVWIYLLLLLIIWR